MSHFFRIPEAGGETVLGSTGSRADRNPISTGISNSAVSPSSAAETASSKRPG
jgi:hypothetical protein